MWTINLGIEQHTSEGVRQKQFQGQKVKCDNETEAVRRCLEFGKAIIDGKISNCSLNDL